MLPRVRDQRSRRDEVDDQEQRRDEPWRGHAARERHEDQGRTEAGKTACRSRDEGDGTDGDRRTDADVRRDQPEYRHPRSVPPVFLTTSATSLAATASISSSVMVFSRGCMVTAIAIDFLASSMPLPS